MATITLLDDRTRPKAPALEGAKDEHKIPGQHLKEIHRHHLQQMGQVRRVMELIAQGSAEPEALKTAFDGLDLLQSMRMFGNLCGQECEMLTAHHDIESYALFPKLHERGNDGIRKVVERLMEEHKIIHAYLEEFETRIGALMAAPNGVNFAGVKDTFVNLERIVQSHFKYEETELETAIGFYGVEL